MLGCLSQSQIGFLLISVVVFFALIFTCVGLLFWKKAEQLDSKGGAHRRLQSIDDEDDEEETISPPRRLEIGGFNQDLDLDLDLDFERGELPPRLPFDTEGTPNPDPNPNPNPAIGCLSIPKGRALS